MGEKKSTQIVSERYVDNSGDRKYFTIIPNYIVNHSTAFEQSLYLVMKRLAGESGTCWASLRKLGDMMGTSPNTVRKFRDKLVRRGWVKKIGHKKTGMTKQLVDEFIIVDLWDLNRKYYEGSVQ